MRLRRGAEASRYSRSLGKAAHHCAGNDDDEQGVQRRPLLDVNGSVENVLVATDCKNSGAKRWRDDGGRYRGGDRQRARVGTQRRKGRARQRPHGKRREYSTPASAVDIDGIALRETPGTLSLAYCL